MLAANIVPYNVQAGSRKLLMLGKRQLVGSSSSYTLNIVITVKDTNTSPEAITAATKALADALGVGSSLPANATLAQLLVELNGIAGNSASPANATQHMLQEVNGAIAALNLSSIFSNATAVEGTLLCSICCKRCQHCACCAEMQIAVTPIVCLFVLNKQCKLQLGHVSDAMASSNLLEHKHCCIEPQQHFQQCDRCGRYTAALLVYGFFHEEASNRIEFCQHRTCCVQI